MTKESPKRPASGYEKHFLISMLRYAPVLTPSQKRQSMSRFRAQLRTNEQAEKRLAELSNQLGSNARELRQRILDQSRMLSEEISSSYEKTSNALDRTAGELREEKVDRSALSSLFAGLSLRLSEDSMPDVDQNKDTD